MTSAVVWRLDGLLLDVLTELGLALERVEARIEHEVTAALARLERMPVAEDAREALAELTRASVWRTA